MYALKHLNVIILHKIYYCKKISDASKLRINLELTRSDLEIRVINDYM